MAGRRLSGPRTEYFLVGETAVRYLNLIRQTSVIRRPARPHTSGIAWNVSRPAEVMLTYGPHIRSHTRGDELGMTTACKLFIFDLLRGTRD
jgi:hypothetical protein